MRVNTGQGHTPSVLQLLLIIVVSCVRLGFVSDAFIVERWETGFTAREMGNTGFIAGEMGNTGFTAGEM